MVASLREGSGHRGDAGARGFPPSSDGGFIAGVYLDAAWADLGGFHHLLMVASLRDVAGSDGQVLRRRFPPSSDGGFIAGGWQVHELCSAAAVSTIF